MDLSTAGGVVATTSGFQVTLNPIATAREFRPVRVSGLSGTPDDPIGRLYSPYADLGMDTSKTLTYTFDRAVTVNLVQFQFTTVAAQPTPPSYIILEAWDGATWANVGRSDFPGSSPLVTWPHPLTAGSEIYPSFETRPATSMNWRIRLSGWPASKVGLFRLGYQGQYAP